MIIDGPFWLGCKWIFNRKIATEKNLIKNFTPKKFVCDKKFVVKNLKTIYD